MVELIVQLPAEADIIVAHAWYSEQHEPLGQQFASALNHTINRVQTNPDQFPSVGGGVQRALVARFPYAVYFVKRADRVYVVAVLHLHRDPSIWQDRARHS